MPSSLSSLRTDATRLGRSDVAEESYFSVIADNRCKVRA